MNIRSLVLALTIISTSFIYSTNPLISAWEKSSNYALSLGLPTDTIRIPAFIIGAGASLYAGYKGVMFILQKIEDSTTTTRIIKQAEEALDKAANYDEIKEISRLELQQHIQSPKRSTRYPYLDFANKLTSTISTIKKTIITLERRIQRITLDEQELLPALKGLVKKAVKQEKELGELKAVVTQFYEYATEDRERRLADEVYIAKFQSRDEVHHHYHPVVEKAPALIDQTPAIQAPVTQAPAVEVKVTPIEPTTNSNEWFLNATLAADDNFNHAITADELN